MEFSSEPTKPSGQEAPNKRELRVLLFQNARVALGATEVKVQLRVPASLSDLEERLVASFPAIEPHLARCGWAIDGDWADWDAQIDMQTEEAALLPPVSGG